MNVRFRQRLTLAVLVLLVVLGVVAAVAALMDSGPSLFPPLWPRPRTSWGTCLGADDRRACCRRRKPRQLCQSVAVGWQRQTKEAPCLSAQLATAGSAPARSDAGRAVPTYAIYGLEVPPLADPGASV
jgi:hypothetical protein